MSKQTDGRPDFAELAKNRGLAEARRAFEMRTAELKQRREQLEHQLQQTSHELLAMQTEFRQAIKSALADIHVDLAPAAGSAAPAKGGSGERLSREESEQCQAQLLSLLSKPRKFSDIRKQIPDKVSDGTIRLWLKNLRNAKKVTTSGERASMQYQAV